MAYIDRLSCIEAETAGMLLDEFPLGWVGVLTSEGLRGGSLPLRLTFAVVYAVSPPLDQQYKLKYRRENTFTEIIPLKKY